MKVWVVYAGVALGVQVAAALLAVVMVGADAAGAIGVAALVAYGVQLVAFGGLVAAGGRPQGFLLAWAGGIGLRFAMVGGVAWWVTRTEALPAAPLLLSLVAFVFVLVLLEAVFLGKIPRTR